MRLEEFLKDEQDPKAVEKVIGKITDLLTNGERVIYIGVQKKPAVNLVPSSIVVTDKRIVFCTPANLGLTTNFDIYSWKDVKEVSFKEGLLGAKFTMVPLSGENFTLDYIPKVQARKLFQFCNQELEAYREAQRQLTIKNETPLAPVVDVPERISESVAAISASVVEPSTSAEDELTLKLKKLKTLFEKQLITQEEYEQKKNELLSDL